jgi:RNA polymerase sigma-70 factor (ECF subfamily)
VNYNKKCVELMTMTNDPKHAEFLKIFMSKRHDIQSFIIGMVRNSAAAEDIFQEVSLILWNKFDTYDEKYSFKFWARGIASKKVLQYWQKQKKSAVSYSPEFMNSVLAAYDRTESNTENMIDALQNCKEKLPENQADLLKYRYEKRYKLDQIAEAIGKSLASTQKTLSRVRFALQDCIKKEMQERESQ